MTRFEDRHLELRKAADASADDLKGWDEWVTPADGRLRTFEEHTGPLVDDLVAALRHWFDIRQHRVDAVGDERMRTELLGQKMEAERRMHAKLAALDEASRG